MATRVLITVDTELTWRHHRHDGSWQTNFERSYEAGGVGVPHQLALLAEHGLKACFFVDPMPALLFGPEPLERMVAPILAAGQEIQLHLHPFWAGLAAGDDKPAFELTELDAERQHEMIATARDLLVAAGVPSPIAFRSGSYAACADTLAALARLGLRYDSSHNGCHHPWPSALPLAPSQIAPVEVAGIVEVPVTQIEEQPGRLRHLQICAVSFREMRSALLYASRKEHPLVTIVGHSFELATRDGRRPNGVISNRFLRLCRFLGAHSQTLPTAAFTELDGLPLGVHAVPMPNRALLRYDRLAGQLWSGIRYERPGELLTAGSGSGIVGAEALLPYVG